jgi:hypothetical protein
MGAGGTSTTLGGVMTNLGGGVISRTGTGTVTEARSGGRTTIALVSGFSLGFGGGS